MTTFTIILTLTTLLLIAIAVSVELGKRNRMQTQKIECLEDEIKGLQSNITYLVNHLEEVARIKKQADEISEKINGAKTDEEVSDIIDAIINANNDRVQDN